MPRFTLIAASIILSDGTEMPLRVQSGRVSLRHAVDRHPDADGTPVSAIDLSSDDLQFVAPRKPIVLPAYLFVWNGPYRFSCVAKDPRLN